MPSVFRQIHTEIWTDEWFLDLPQKDKLLFIYLFSNDRTQLAGIYDISVKLISFHTDLPQDYIVTALERFGNAGKAYYENGLIWIPKLLTRNANNLTSQTVQANIRKTILGIPSCNLLRRWIGYYNGIIAPRYGIKALSIPSLQEQEQEQEQDKEQEQEQQQQHATDTPAVAADVREEVNKLGITDPKATDLVNDYQARDELPDLLPRLRANIVHNKGQPGIENPIGLAITQTEARQDPPAPDDSRRIVMCPKCSAHPCLCEELGIVEGHN